MKGRFYRVTRDLHLYVGLFISPFVLVFAVSVFFLVHPSEPRADSVIRVVSDVPLPANLSSLSGRALIDALQPALERAGVQGEVGFVQHRVRDHRLIVPVTIPGRETTVTIDTLTRSAEIEQSEKGLAEAFVVLHKSPGPHLANIRMNWIYMALWKWFADAVAYVVVFLTSSGIYLWYALRAERIAGIGLLAAGAISFVAIVYALSHV